MSTSKSDWVVTAAGVELDLSRLRLPDDLAARYRKPLQAALAEMRAIEAGEIVNRDEKWQVGHYWLRDPERAPEEYRKPIRDVWEQIDRFVAEQFEGRFPNILWIGIGGSGLAPQLLYDGFRVPGKTPRMFFFDNTDPAGFSRTLLEIEGAGGLKQTLTVVVSKGGTTPETANGLQVARTEYSREGLDFARHAVAITRPESALDKQAAEEGWLARFPIWNWVGGRTSLLSAVGLLPARLLGMDMHALIAGAQQMDEATRKDEFDDNPALQLAAAWYHTVETEGLRNMVVLPYCDRLALFGRYLQQLLMESLGKKGKGITVYGNKGSTDQHSFVQQLRDGYRDFFATFVRVNDPGTRDWEVKPGLTANQYLLAFQEGTEQALTDAGRPSLRLSIDRLDEHVLGALVALFERAVGFYGAMLGINAYHQPGVEAGKKAAQAILERRK